MTLARNLALLMTVAACSCASHAKLSARQAIASTDAADPEHHLVLASGKRCPVSRVHLQEMVSLWKLAATDRCLPKRHEILVAPTPILVNVSKLCVRAYDPADYFTDVSGSFRCR